MPDIVCCVHISCLDNCLATGNLISKRTFTENAKKLISKNNTHSELVMAILLLPQKNINLTKNLRQCHHLKMNHRRGSRSGKKKKECSIWKTKVKTRGLNGRQ